MKNEVISTIVLYVISVIAMLVSVFACSSPDLGKENRYRRLRTPTIEVRQLVKVDETNKQSSGSYFLIAGGFSSSESVETFVKVFAKIGETYQFLEMPIDKIRVNLDNNLAAPNIQLEYSSRKVESVSELVNGRASRSFHYKISYRINCPESFLPENLLPITL